MFKDLATIASCEESIARLEAERLRVKNNVNQIRKRNIAQGKGYSTTPDEIVLIDEYQKILEKLQQEKDKYRILQSGQIFSR